MREPKCWQHNLVKTVVTESTVQGSGVPTCNSSSLPLKHWRFYLPDKLASFIKLKRVREGRGWREREGERGLRAVRGEMEEDRVRVGFGSRAKVIVAERGKKVRVRQAR